MNNKVLKFLHDIKAYKDGNVWFIPHICFSRRLSDSMTVDDILEMIYNEGVYNGKKKGRKEIQSEFKKLLERED